MNLNINCTDTRGRPLGDSVTVLNAIDRGELDDYFFKADEGSTIFSPDNLKEKSLPFTTVVNEYIHKGQTSYGGTMTFELGSASAGAADLLLSSYIQVELDHWLPEQVRRYLASGYYTYSTSGSAGPEPAWTYINSMGSALIEYASLQIDELEVERIDGTYAHLWASVVPDVNSQVGPATDGLGIKPWNSYTVPYVYPTLNGSLACFLPFSFGRQRQSAAFPLASVSGTVRIVVRFRPFHEVVQRVDGSKASCTDTPLGKTYTFLDPSAVPHTITTSTEIPQPRSVSLITYGALTTGKFRSALLRTPFEKLYREVYSFVFNEPLKYTVNKVGDTVSIQLPLELNNPCEEIWWVVRRKAATDLNEWTNYSATPWSVRDPIYNPPAPALVRGSLYINGQPVAEDQPETYYRRCVADAHKGGIVPYDRYIYGYVFSRRPGERQPAGHVNMSRATDVKLALTVEMPADGLDQEWTVAVYAHCMNWMRFENGLANRLYSS